MPPDPLINERHALHRLSAALTSSADNPGHLTYEELEALACETAEPGARAHTDSCPVCAAELTDLIAFRRTLAPPAKIAPRFPRPAAILIPIAAGLLFLFVRPAKQIPPAKPATVASARVAPALLQDGNAALSLSPAGTLTGIPDLSAPDRQALADALATGRLPASASLPDLRRQPETLLSGAATSAGSLRPVFPLGFAVLDPSPEFRWTPVSGATAYRVTVYSDNFEPVLSGSALASTSWRATQPLPRDRTYIWTVTATVAGKQITAPRAPQPEARFRVASAGQAAELAALARRQPGSALLLAIRAAEAGLIPEATAALNRLAAENPGSPLVSRLRASLAK